MNDRRHIALLLPNLSGGGVERISLDLAREFTRIGHDVDLVLMRLEGEFLADAQTESSIIDLQAPRFRYVLPRLIGYLRNTRPDALIAAKWPLTVIAPAAALIARFPGPVAVSEHGMIYSAKTNDKHGRYGQPRRSRRLARRISSFIGYRLATARIGVSEGVCEEIAGMSLMNASRMTTIHNPVRAPLLPDAESLAKVNALWDVPSGRRILTVGRMMPEKNHPLLLHAFALMADPGARLMLLGQGAGEGALRALAAELGIAGQVIFPGFHVDPTPFYATADLFVLSSNNEGLPTVLVEALSCGLPVVSTDCRSGPAEILEGGRWGRLTPVGDAGALARAMAGALATPHDPEALRRRAAHFSPERAAKAYLAAMGLE